jgi:Tol biopolymer transport system component
LVVGWGASFCSWAGGAPPPPRPAPGTLRFNGRFLTFTTADDGFVVPDTNGFFEDAWLVDRATGRYHLVGVNDAGQQGDDNTVAGPVSNDGRFVALVSRSTNLGGPANLQENVYVRDLAAGTTRLVSVGDDGAEGDLDSIDPAMTPDGRAIAFASRSSTFVPETQDFFGYDIFVRDIRRR